MRELIVLVVTLSVLIFVVDHMVKEGYICVDGPVFCSE